jgi:hypothetical protein
VTTTATTPDLTTEPPSSEAWADGEEFDAWADAREARLLAAYRRWLTAGKPPTGLVDLLSEALQDAPFTTRDVAEWLAHHVGMTGKLPVIGPTTLAGLLRVRIVPNGPLRAAYLDAMEHGGSPAAVARSAGLVEPDGSPETTRLERLLGFTPNGASLAFTLDYETAERIAAALAVPPHSVGV